MIDIIYITYHIDNLKFSLKALQDLNYDFNLIIHNDNPEIKLTKEWLLENCELNKIPYKKLTILNEDENVGMLFSRINAFKSIENQEYTLFMDDDDYLLVKDLPEFDGHTWYRYDIQQIFSNDLNDTGRIKCNFGICASFWKSSLLSKAFSILEKIPFEYKINELEDITIQVVTQAVAFKYRLPYLKHINFIGSKYRKYLDNTIKYDHIVDPRYCKNPKYPDYLEKILQYHELLKERIITGKYEL